MKRAACITPDDPVQEVADGGIDFEHVSSSYRRR